MLFYDFIYAINKSRKLPLTGVHVVLENIENHVTCDAKTAESDFEEFLTKTAVKKLAIRIMLETVRNSFIHVGCHPPKIL